jgi:hypothetical protein
MEKTDYTNIIHIESLEHEKLGRIHSTYSSHGLKST